MTKKLRKIVQSVIAAAALMPTAALADGGAPYLHNPIKCDNFLCLVMDIIRFFMAGVATIAVLMFVYGGYVFLTSAGNAEAVKKGKDILLWATVGIVAILGSWVALQFVLQGLTGNTN